MVNKIVPHVLPFANKAFVLDSLYHMSIDMIIIALILDKTYNVEY